MNNRPTFRYRNNYRGGSGSGRRWTRRPYYRGAGFGRGNRVLETNLDDPPSDTSGDNDHTERFHIFNNNNDAKIVNDSTVVGPYCGWNMYIPDETYSESLPLLVKLRALETYYKGKGLYSNRDDIEERGFFTLNYKDICKDEHLLKVWPNIKDDIVDNPEKCLNYFGLAMHKCLSTAETSSNTTENPLAADCSTFYDKLPKINARLTDFEPQLQMKNLKSNYYGKYISVRGTIIRVSNVKPLCTKLAFQCGKCGKEFAYSQPYGKYTCPLKCASNGCRSQIFNPLRCSPKTETVNWQSIRLQEIANDQKEVGRIPRCVDCELTYDLVDSCVPGDVVNVSGIVNVTTASEGRSNKDKSTYTLYILANSISNCQGKEVSSVVQSSVPVGLDFTLKDLYAVQAIQAEDNLFKLLCASLCPSIYGHEIVKAGLVLALFGGTQKFLNKNNRIPVRGDPHVLIVGDPGLGKSQMLQACANVAARGVFVCGNTTSTSGLTVTLSRESGSGGDFALEAGALVLADQGCCCIDEFDKMSNQHQALLEAMEQQTISIAKAGIVCSLPARTSILAAANPIGGHYNKAKTVSENLKMGSALLSRFDLVFILLDKPDQELDSKLSEHVMSLHSKESQLSKFTPGHLNVSQARPGSSRALNRHESDEPLAKRLRYDSNETCEHIPHQLLRKYIAYARKYVNAKISKKAADEIQKFYLELRKRLHSSDSTPITTRQLESLIRLTEARAKLELRESCTREDALDVIEIMKQSMIDVWSDDFGVLDITRSQHGSGMSGRSQAKKLVSLLTRLSERTNNSMFSTQQLKQIANDAGIHILDFENFLASLNMQGFLIKKGRGLYKLLSVDY